MDIHLVWVKVCSVWMRNKLLSLFLERKNILFVVRNHFEHKNQNPSNWLKKEVFFVKTQELFRKRGET